MAASVTPPAAFITALEACAAERSLRLTDVYDLSETFGLSLSAVEWYALEKNIFPYRYLRNRHTLDAKAQLRLMQSHVLLVGCGGIGGFVAQLLAQTGVGRLTLYDPDCFEESNLNRQNFCTVETIGKPKSEVCAKRLQEINPVMEVLSHVEAFEQTMLNAHLPVNLLIEASDDPVSKRALSMVFKEHQINFLHTALAGESFLLSFNHTLEHYYADDGKGAEAWTGNLAATAAAVAAMATSQIVRILTGRETALLGSMIMVDLASMESSAIPYE